MSLVKYAQVLKAFKGFGCEQNSILKQSDIIDIVNTINEQKRTGNKIPEQLEQILWNKTPKKTSSTVVLTDYINYLVDYCDYNAQFRNSANKGKQSTQNLTIAKRQQYTRFIISTFQDRQPVYTYSHPNQGNYKPIKIDKSDSRQQLMQMMPEDKNSQFYQKQFQHQQHQPPIQSQQVYCVSIQRQIFKTDKFKAEESCIQVQRSGQEKIQIKNRFVSANGMNNAMNNAGTVINIYVPAVLRMQLNKVKQIEEGVGKATIDCKFSLRILTNNLSDQLITTIRRNLDIQFLDLQAQERILSLYQQSVTPDGVVNQFFASQYLRENNQIYSEFSKVLEVKALTDIKWTPFDKMKLIASVNLKEISLLNVPDVRSFLGLTNTLSLFNSSVNIRFNMLQYMYNQEYYDTSNHGQLSRCMAQIIYKPDQSHINDYELAQRLVQAQNTSEYVSSDNFQYYHQHFQIEDSFFVKWCQKIRESDKPKMSQEYIQARDATEEQALMEDVKKQQDAKIKQILIYQQQLGRQRGYQVDYNIPNTYINSNTTQVQAKVSQQSRRIATSSFRPQNFPNPIPNQSQYANQSALNNHQVNLQNSFYNQQVNPNQFSINNRKMQNNVNILSFEPRKKQYDSFLRNERDRLVKASTKHLFRSNSHSVTHFKLPFYRLSLSTILYLLLPPYFLGLISLTIFFSIGGLDGFVDRLATIATLALAYIAFIQVIKDKIPAVPTVTYVEMINYAQIFITFLALVESFVSNVEQDIYQFVWYTNPFFWVAFLIQLLITIFILFMLIKFYFFQLPRYNCKTGFRVIFRPQEWKNEKCQQQFNKRMTKSKRLYYSILYSQKVEPSKIASKMFNMK